MPSVDVLPRPVLLFSDRSRLCRWAARIVSRVDGRGELTMLPLDHEDACALLSAVPRDRRNGSWWLVLRDGSPLRGDRSGVLFLLVALWLARPVGRVPAPLRVSSFHDTLVETAARYRASLST